MKDAVERELGLAEYRVRKVLGLPRLLWMRRKERNKEPLAIAYLESVRYSPEAYQFISATMAQPALLTTFDNLGPGAIAVDVGAFEGKWCGEVADRYQCEVEAFELSPEFFGVLADVAREHEGVHIREYGLGGRDETVRVSRTNMGSSVFVNPRSGEQVEWTDAHIRDVAAVWDELGWDRVAVLKVNIEGGEYDLLERLSDAGLLARVDCLLVQFHDWIPNGYARRRAIRRTLAETHDEAWCYDWAWEKWARKP